MDILQDAAVPVDWLESHSTLGVLRRELRLRFPSAPVFMSLNNGKTKFLNKSYILLS